MPGDPECAPDEEIVAFLGAKRGLYKIISEQVDFNDRDEEAVRYNEIYTPSVPLDLAQFGDFGCRFRYNKFDRQDYWWTGSKLLNNISIIKNYKNRPFD